jgi:hypothetical protein
MFKMGLLEMLCFGEMQSHKIAQTTLQAISQATSQATHGNA